MGKNPTGESAGIEKTDFHIEFPLAIVRCCAGKRRIFFCFVIIEEDIDDYQ